MLSQENINKLCMTGIYRAHPEDFSKTSSSDPYWCKNWTFRVIKDRDDEYVMADTYWSSSPNCISLNDDNFDKFTLLFDLNEVEKYKGSHFEDYEEKDRWMVPMDSGGRSHSYKYIRKGSAPSKKRVVERLREEIYALESKLRYKREDLQKVLADKVDLRRV